MTDTPENTDQFGNTLLHRDYLGYGVTVALVRHEGAPWDYRLSITRPWDETITDIEDGLIEHAVYLSDDEIDALIRYRDRMRGAHVD